MSKHLLLNTAFCVFSICCALPAIAAPMAAAPQTYYDAEPYKPTTYPGAKDPMEGYQWNAWHGSDSAQFPEKEKIMAERARAAQLKAREDASLAAQHKFEEEHPRPSAGWHFYP